MQQLGSKQPLNIMQYALPSPPESCRAKKSGTGGYGDSSWAGVRIISNAANWRPLGERESGTARLEEAVAAYRDALEIRLDWAMTTGNQGEALMLLAERTRDVATAETALGQIEAASETLRSGGDLAAADYFEARLPKAHTIRDQLNAR
jgi:hypothetical protein